MDKSLPIIRIATWSEDEHLIRAVRHAVFVLEQAIPKDLDFDGTDPFCRHAQAFVEGAPVATGRMGPDGHIGRIAVLKAWRHRRIGSDLIRCFMKLAWQQGHDRVYLNAQRSAVGFYAKLGFREVGEPFMEAGIEHSRMERATERPGGTASSRFEDMAGTVGRPEVFKTVEAFQIRFLTFHGLLPEHTCLDLGCGVLRGGLPVIRYLNPGHYSGIDVDADLIGVAWERIREARLMDKAPALQSEASFADYRFPRRFDFIMAYRVLIHLTDPIVDECLGLVSRVLADNGTCFANVNIGSEPDRRWKNRFPVVYRAHQFYEAAAARHGLSLGLLQMTDWERRNWFRQECLEIRLMGGGNG